jgi:D-aminopeptidase
MATGKRDDSGKPRARDLGIELQGVPGAWNAITDVPGVEVGYETIIRGEGALVVGQGPVRTGVTVVLPGGRARLGASCPAGWHSLNGNGEITGTAWLDEAGSVSLPIAITNTHAVGPVHRGVIDWALKRRPELASRWHLPVVAETWDGYLSDVNGPHVTEETTETALDNARRGPLQEGSVGGGTGMSCYGYKAGTGTSSRRLRVAGGDYMLGAIVQANFGQRSELVVAGRHIGALLTDDNPMRNTSQASRAGAGSCVAVIATDVPLLPLQCKALARRGPLGLARTGTTGSHFSGDLFVAFAAANFGRLDSTFAARDNEGLRSMEFLPWGAMDALYKAVVECVEESVLNALVAAEDMVGRDGHRSPGFPVERLQELLAGT